MKVSRKEFAEALGHPGQSPPPGASPPGQLVPVERVADLGAAAVAALTEHPPAPVTVNAPVTVLPAPVHIQPAKALGWKFTLTRDLNGWITEIKATPTPHG